MRAVAAVFGDDGVMSTARPDDDPAQAPTKRRNPWVWVCIVLAVAAAGLLVWALTIQSDLDSTEQDVAALESQAEQNKESGAEALTAAEEVYDDLTGELGATSEDLAATEQDLDEAEQAAKQAEEDAAAAEEEAAAAASETEKSAAEAEQAKADAKAAESKATVTLECAKAYFSALGALFEGDSVREQAPIVREQVEKITADCKAAFGGG